MNIYSLYFDDSNSAVNVPFSVNSHWGYSQSPQHHYSLRNQLNYKKKPSSFLNGVSAGEAKSLKPIRCVIDSFLKAACLTA